MNTLWITSEPGKHKIALTLSVCPRDRLVPLFHYSYIVTMEPTGLVVPLLGK